MPPKQKRTQNSNAPTLPKAPEGKFAAIGNETLSGSSGHGHSNSSGSPPERITTAPPLMVEETPQPVQQPVQRPVVQPEEVVPRCFAHGENELHVWLNPPRTQESVWRNKHGELYYKIPTIQELNSMNLYVITNGQCFADTDSICAPAAKEHNGSNESNPGMVPPAASSSPAATLLANTPNGPTTEDGRNRFLQFQISSPTLFLYDSVLGPGPASPASRRSEASPMSNPSSSFSPTFPSSNNSLTCPVGAGTEKDQLNPIAMHSAVPSSKRGKGLRKANSSFVGYGSANEVFSPSSSFDLLNREEEEEEDAMDEQNLAVQQRVPFQPVWKEAWKVGSNLPIPKSEQKKGPNVFHLGAGSFGSVKKVSAGHDVFALKRIPCARFRTRNEIETAISELLVAQDCNQNAGGFLAKAFDVYFDNMKIWLNVDEEKVLSTELVRNKGYFQLLHNPQYPGTWCRSGAKCPDIRYCLAVHRNSDLGGPLLSDQSQEDEESTFLFVLMEKLQMTLGLLLAEKKRVCVRAILHRRWQKMGNGDRGGRQHYRKVVEQECTDSSSVQKSTLSFCSTASIKKTERKERTVLRTEEASRFDQIVAKSCRYKKAIWNRERAVGWKPFSIVREETACRKLITIERIEFLNWAKRRLRELKKWNSLEEDFKAGQMDERFIGRVGYCILHALRELHTERHIIHSDLSMNNIMLTPDYSAVKLLDFGCCLKIFYDEKTRQPIYPKFRTGTATYRAPETYGNYFDNREKGQDSSYDAYLEKHYRFGEEPLLSPAADLFSLGIILLELFLGFPPLPEESRCKILETLLDNQKKASSLSWDPPPASFPPLSPDVALQFTTTTSSEMGLSPNLTNDSLVGPTGSLLPTRGASPQPQQSNEAIKGSSQPQQKKEATSGCTMDKFSAESGENEKKMENLLPFRLSASDENTDMPSYLQISDEFKEVLTFLLHWNPKKRTSANELLELKFFKDSPSGTEFQGMVSEIKGTMTRQSFEKLGSTMSPSGSRSLSTSRHGSAPSSPRSTSPVLCVEQDVAQAAWKQRMDHQSSKRLHEKHQLTQQQGFSKKSIQKSFTGKHNRKQ